MNTNVSAVENLKIDGFEVSVWTRVSGKERVYLKLVDKLNGGRTWNGGCGREDYLDLSTGVWHEKTGWAGARTRDAYRDAVDAARALVEAAISR